MTKINPKVTIELTERELSYLYNKIGFPNGRFPQLQGKLYEAAKRMRIAKRIARRSFPSPVPKTFEERIAFEKAWDAKVEAGRK